MKLTFPLFIIFFLLSGWATAQTDSLKVQLKKDSLNTSTQPSELKETLPTDSLKAIIETEEQDNVIKDDSLNTEIAEKEKPPVNNTVNFNPNLQYEIGGITVSGTKHLDRNILISLSGLAVGDKINIPGEDIQDAIKNLWGQGLFENIKIDATKVVNEVVFLDIELTERARLSKYKFTGLRKVEEDDVRSKIPLARGRVVTQNVKQSTINAIENYFIEKGFLLAKADIKEIPDTARANHVIVDVIVKRGEKVKINEIIVRGNDNVLDRDIKKAMRDTKERTRIQIGKPKQLWKEVSDGGIGNRLGNITIKGLLRSITDKFRLRIFNPSKLIEKKFEDDKDNILAYYNTKGYRDAQITNDSIIVLNDRYVNLLVDVEEGEKYYFRNIEWEGNTKYSTELLDRILNIQAGEVYDQSRLDEGLFVSQNSTDVSALYMDDGYLFFQVIPTEKTIEGDSIDLLIKVQEGPQATVNDIIIEGNTKTNEHVIRREIRTMPGNKFSRSDIIRTQRELAALGYFDPEAMGVNPIPDPVNGTVDIKYTVAEQPSDQFELSAGWGGGSIIGSLGVTFNNFSLREMFSEWDPVPSGDGQRLSLRYQANTRAFQSFSASFTEPWLGGKRPTSLSIAGFSSLQTNSFRDTFDWNDTTRTDLRGLLTLGSSISIGTRLKVPDDFFTLSTELNYQHYRLKNYQGFLVRDGRFNNLSLRTTLARYSVGINPVYPTEGSNISLTMQLTPPYSSFRKNDGTDFYEGKSIAERHKWTEYHKWKFKAEWYTRLKGDFVLKTSAKMGFMGTYRESVGMSPFERFELGDDGLSNFNLYGKDIIALRGYEVLSNGPGIEDDGGLPYYNKFSLELRYPFSLNPSSTIFALAFLEGGNSWATFKEWNAFDLRRSAGIGLRFFLPMFGTIGFDYGVGFDKDLGPAVNFWDYIGNYGKFSVILGVEPE